MFSTSTFFVFIICPGLQITIAVFLLALAHAQTFSGVLPDADDPAADRSGANFATRSCSFTRRRKSKASESVRVPNPTPPHSTPSVSISGLVVRRSDREVDVHDARAGPRECSFPSGRIGTGSTRASEKDFTTGVILGRLCD